MAAIYMWRWRDQIVLTTTPYPPESIDGATFSCELNQGILFLIPREEIFSSTDLLDATYTQLRWFYYDGPYLDEIYSTTDLLDASYTQLRWFYYDGPYLDEIYSTTDLLDFQYIPKIIYADSPDEGVQFSAITLNTSSMSPV